MKILGSLYATYPEPEKRDLAKVGQCYVRPCDLGMSSHVRLKLSAKVLIVYYFTLP